MLEDRELIGEILEDNKGELSLQKAIELYKKVHMSSRNFSPQTRRACGHDIEQFLEFLMGLIHRSYESSFALHWTLLKSSLKSDH